MFKKAEKKQAFIRMAVAGPAGSGKTYTSLLIATRMAERIGKPIAVLDTEHGSATKYADIFTFDTAVLEGDYHPKRYIEAIHAAENAGYGVLIIDSLSHAWFGKGGILDLVEQIAKRRFSGNKFAAWSEATPIHQALIEAILAARLHVIATMRSKTEYIETVDDKGRKTIQRAGLQPVQRDTVEYEFDVYATLDPDHTMIVHKSRCPALADMVVQKPGPEVADILLEWAGWGKTPAPTPAPELEPQQSPEETLQALLNATPASAERLAQKLGAEPTGKSILTHRPDLAGDVEQSANLAKKWEDHLLFASDEALAALAEKLAAPDSTPKALAAHTALVWLLANGKRPEIQNLVEKA